MLSKNIDIKSINIKGEAELLISDHQSALTAYNKQAIKSDAIYLNLTGFEGDMVNDTKHHGGNDKAICCYNADRYTYWKNTLGIDMQIGAFGENLTLIGESGLEENVCIGDRYKLGESIVEVSEPRGPCYIIGIKYNLKKFPLLCQQTGYTGFYLRTIKKGWVKHNDILIHLSTHPEKISVKHINFTRYHDNKNKEALMQLVNLHTLTFEWRKKLKIILSKL